MKPRMVVVEIEMETAESITHIRDWYLGYWSYPPNTSPITEVRVNVIRATKRKARGKARRRK